MNELPKFFNYKDDDGVEEPEQGYETMQDFFLSWTFRCADEKFELINPALHLYAKKALFFLIYGNMQDYKEAFTVTKVRVWRQWSRIDLVVEVDTTTDDVATKYVLNIENKWYTHIREGQLDNAWKAMKAYYQDGKPENNRDIINLVIYGDRSYEDNPQIRKECEDNNYKFITVDDISDFMDTGGVKTGNALFDEYWFN